MTCLAMSSSRLAEAKRGLLDTSVVVGLEDIDPSLLPAESSVSAVTIAQLAAGPHATPDPVEKARRQARLQATEATMLAFPFDTAAARAFGLLYSVQAASGRKVRGRRALDLLIAATARAQAVPLYTRNADDFAGLEDFVDIIAV